jgi:DNA-binding NarL/FixJ family response regulator
MNVLINDNQPIAAMGIKLIIEKHFEKVNISITTKHKELLASCKEKLYEVIILGNITDIKTMRTLLEDIRKLQDNTKILIYTDDESGINEMSLMSFGANGVISRSSKEEDFVMAINVILAGFAFLSQNFVDSYSNTNNEMAAQNPFKKLSRRELDVYKMLSQGDSVKNISKTLELHQSTISTLKKRILEKMGAKNIVHMLKVSQEYEMSY